MSTLNLPGVSSHVRELIETTLERNAALHGAFAPYVAREAPVAPETWEQAVVLPTTQPATQRLAFTAPNPCLVIGAKTTVTPALFSDIAASWTGGGVLNLPRKEWFEISVDTGSSKLQRTKQDNRVSAGAVLDSDFVTLDAVDVETPRLWMLLLPEPRPEIGITFRSVWATASASGLPAAVFLKIALFVLPLYG